MTGAEGCATRLTAFACGGTGQGDAANMQSASAGHRLIVLAGMVCGVTVGMDFGGNDGPTP